MNCPICNVDLQLAERQGVEIDYCPKCRGVWLDRGELDKIIERAASIPYGHGRDDERSQYEKRDDDKYDDDYKHGDRRRRKRGGFLEELFDF